jgi:hypothetical protein
MVDLAFKTQEQIMDFWKFFVPSIMVLLGWIFSRKYSWSWLQRIGVAVAYSGFMVFNIDGLFESYVMLSVIVDQLKSLNMPPDHMTWLVFNAVITRLDLGESWKYGMVFHIVVDFIVLYFILIEAGQEPHVPERGD